MPDSLSEFLQNDLVCALSVTVILAIMDCRYFKKRPSVLKAAIVFACVISWLILMNLIRGGDIFSPAYMILTTVKNLGLFIALAALSFFLYRCGFWTGVFLSTVTYCLYNGSVKLSEGVGEFFTSVQNSSIVLSVLTISAVAALFFLVFTRSMDFSGIADFDSRNKRVLLTVSFTVNVFVMFLENYFHKSLLGMTPDIASFEGTAGLRLYVNFAASVMSFLALIISLCQIYEVKNKREAEITRQMLRAESQRYELEKSAAEAINIKCHDIRHQIAALGDGAARRELTEIGKLIDIYDCGIKTGNEALDIAVSRNASICVSKGIQFTCVADGSLLSFMEDGDIYALMGNIIENAIDASDSVSEAEKRVISVTVSRRGGFALISEMNYFEGELRMSEGMPLTSKEDKQNHGFGVRSIRMVTEKYGGDLQIEADGGIFRLSVMLPLA